jgi:hypothetical protein
MGQTIVLLYLEILPVSCRPNITFSAKSTTAIKKNTTIDGDSKKSGSHRIATRAARTCTNLVSKSYPNIRRHTNSERIDEITPSVANIPNIEKLSSFG